MLCHAPDEMTEQELNNLGNTAAWLMYRGEQYDQARTLVADGPIEPRLLKTGC